MARAQEIDGEVDGEVVRGSSPSSPGRPVRRKPVVWLVGVLVVAAVGVGVVMSRGGGGRRIDVAEPVPTSVDHGALAGCAPAEVDGSEVAWSEIEASFDASGPFRLPVRPDWVAEEAYCEAVLDATLAAPPGLPTFDEHPHVDGGPNRFVVFDNAGGGEPRRVEVNRVLLQLHPLSVHEAFDPAGRRIGSFAPGASFVPSAEASAAEVAADPVTTAAVAAEVESCTRAACDPDVRAALAAGDDAMVGRPISLP